MINEGTRGERVVASDNAGIYSVPALVPGLYTISVEMKGFHILQSTRALNCRWRRRPDWTSNWKLEQ